MPFKIVQIASPEMGEGTALIIGILSFLLFISGGWWLLNRMALHPRSILTNNDVKSVPFPATHNKAKSDLPVVFRMYASFFCYAPFTVWNIYWRRNDFVRFDFGQVEYRSGYTTGKLIPAEIGMHRGRSWRFDLTNLFRGQMASSWFVDIVPMPGQGKKPTTGEEEHVILDLKAMNLGGSAKSIAKLLARLYGDKFLINNQLPG